MGCRPSSRVGLSQNKIKNNMTKEIENTKAVVAPVADGKSNETTTGLPANRNGKTETKAEAVAEKRKAKAIAEAKKLAEAAKKAKAKTAKRRTARAKAKKAKHSTTELITIKHGGKSVGFVFWEGCNLKDFTAKNMPTVGQLDREAAQAVLNKVANAYMLTSGRFESVKIGKVSASYDRLSKSYVPNVAMRGRLRRETTKAERSEAFAKDESRFLQSIAERRLAL